MNGPLYRIVDTNNEVVFENTVENYLEVLFLRRQIAIYYDVLDSTFKTERWDKNEKKWIERKLSKDNPNESIYDEAKIS
jgi:hypothetical protein